MSVRRHIFLPLAAALLLGLGSCRLISGILHDDDVVAKVGNVKLYRAEVVSVIPAGVSPEDSLNMAQQYIRTWASEHIFEDAAAHGLSKKDLDVTGQLDQYRRALLKYRFEEQFINERLDTLVGDAELKAYYDANSARYELDFPIVKARFVRMGQDNPQFNEIVRLMSSDDEEKLAELDELAPTVAAKYTDFALEWMDIRTLAEEFGVDYGTLLALMSQSSIRYMNSDGSVSYARILDYMRAGTIPPLEYCAPRIRETIMNSRRLELMNSLERDLLENARSNGTFVIF